MTSPGCRSNAQGEVMKFYLTGAVALILACGAVQSTQAKKEDELITLTGCVQGFAQGGYFLSDSTDKKGKPKHYLLVNDNDEVKAFTGKWRSEERRVGKE